MNFEDDIFDENASEFAVIEKDWMKVKQSREKAGFVAGSSTGQESTLQVGFNAGLKYGFLSSFLLSEIKGILNALMAYRAAYEGHPITDDIVLDAQHLLDDISMLETDQVAQEFFCLKISPISQGKTLLNLSDGETYNENDYINTLSMDVDDVTLNNSNLSSQPHVPENDECCNNNQCGSEMQSLPCHGSNNEARTYGNSKCNNKDKVSSEQFCWDDSFHKKLKLTDANEVLRSCPQIADIVRRCKHILKRLHWTDSMIDNLL